MADANAAKSSFGFTKIIVRDLDGAVDFYDKILGLKLVQTVEFPHLIEKLLAAPGQEAGPFLVLYHEFEGAPLKHGNAWGPIGFQVPDVDATYAEALAAGGTADMEPFNYEDVRVAMFCAPEGHKVELIGAPGSAK